MHLFLLYSDCVGRSMQKIRMFTTYLQVRDHHESAMGARTFTKLDTLQSGLTRTHGLIKKWLKCCVEVNRLKRTMETPLPIDYVDCTL